MLQITPHQTILLAINPVDFRKGIDSLAGFCNLHLSQDPFSGKLFVFTNRGLTKIKILVYDGQGFWLCLKRFSKGKLAWWPKKEGEITTSVLASQLQIILYQGSPLGAQIPENWREIKQPSEGKPFCPG